MVFRRYIDVESFKDDVLDILLEDEVRNNLQISIVLNSSKYNSDNWLLSTVKDEQGVIVLIAICTLPFHLLLYEPVYKKEAQPLPSQDWSLCFPLCFLAAELKRIGFGLTGVYAQAEIARRFADVYCGVGNSTLIRSLKIMRLDKLSDYDRASGFYRMLTEKDLSFVPSWEHAFCIDCDIPLYTYVENYERVKSRLDKNIHFIWEDGVPVAQAVHGRDTPGGAVISWVYTPPEYRNKGYAASVVAEVSRSALYNGKKFCCLFADAANPASCAVYHKLGYYDVCSFEEIKFDTEK